MGAPMETRLIRREGRAGGAMPLHMAKVRSDNRGPEGAADGRAPKPGSTAGEGRHRTKPLVPEAGPGGTNCAVKLLTEEAETSLILRRPRAAESHAMSRCEQPERGSTHHSTREAALCVGGTQGDDESDAKHSHRGSS